MKIDCKHDSTKLYGWINEHGHKVYGDICTSCENIITIHESLKSMRIAKIVDQVRGKPMNQVQTEEEEPSPRSCKNKLTVMKINDL